MNCLYYDSVLQKPVPCLVTQQVYTIDYKKHVNILYDASQFNTWNTNIQELNRYSTHHVRIINLYPNNTPEQLTYAQACIPNKIANPNTFEFDELVRFQTLVGMILNSGTVSTDTFYKLADFLSYEVLFLFLQTGEKHFMLYISNNPLSSLNTAAVIASCGGITTIIPYLLTCLTLFTSYDCKDTVYYIQNIMNLAGPGADGVKFPLQLNIPLLQTNLQFLKDNGYLG